MSTASLTADHPIFFHKEDHSPSPLVRTSNLSLGYGRRTQIFDGISLGVTPGECLVLVGPSGSGKTSLLDCIAGRIGSIRGKISGEIDRVAEIASIHQDLKLVGSLTTLQNVLHGAIGRYSFARTLFGFPKAERKQALALLERVGISHRAHLPACRLSGGEKQRLAIARALMQRPRVLLADEPVTALDNENAHAIMQLISDLAREDELGVIVVLHDRRLATQYADRILELRDGKLCEQSFETVQSQVPSPHQKPAAPPRTEMPRAKRSLSQKIRFGGWMTLLAVALVYLWSWQSLEVSSGEFHGALSGLLQFVSGLFPTNFAQLQAIPWGTLLSSLVETVQMAIVGTTVGVVFALPLAALAARNTGPRFLREPIRFCLNAIRTIPSLIWALLFVSAVGLGPLAGILALVAYSVGYLTKFFYESLEEVDPGPPAALKEIGASGLQRFFHAVWPAAQAATVSDIVFMLEYNVRSASVLGIVDAGGIGFYIKEYIDFRFFPAVTAALFLVLLVVLTLDTLSRWMRTRLVNNM